MLNLLLAAQIGLAPVTPAPNAIAVVNVERVLAESSMGKTLMARVNALRSEREREAAERQAALDTAVRRGEVAPAVQRLRLDLQRFTEDAQTEIADATRSVEAEFETRLAPVLKKILEDDHLGLILEVPNPVVVWAHPSTDVTVKAIQLLDHPAPPKP
jgi:Skp family chaperone for outer membrane proteins